MPTDLLTAFWVDDLPFNAGLKEVERIFAPLSPSMILIESGRRRALVFFATLGALGQALGNYGKCLQGREICVSSVDPRLLTYLNGRLQDVSKAPHDILHKDLGLERTFLEGGVGPSDCREPIKSPGVEWKDSKIYVDRQPNEAGDKREAGAAATDGMLDKGDFPSVTLHRPGNEREGANLGGDLVEIAPEDWEDVYRLEEAFRLGCEERLNKPPQRGCPRNIERKRQEKGNSGKPGNEADSLGGDRTSASVRAKEGSKSEEKTLPKTTREERSGETYQKRYLEEHPEPKDPRTWRKPKRYSERRENVSPLNWRDPGLHPKPKDPRTWRKPKRYSERRENVSPLNWRDPGLHHQQRLMSQSLP